MSIIQLRLETLKDLDNGRPAVAFEQSVTDAVRDCIDRPGAVEEIRDYAMTINIRKTEAEKRISSFCSIRIQREVARMLGVSRALICKIEKNALLKILPALQHELREFWPMEDLSDH